MSKRPQLELTEQKTKKQKIEETKEKEKEAGAQSSKGENENAAAQQFSQSFLDLALNFFSQADPAPKESQVDFDLYGPPDDEKETKERRRKAQAAYQQIFTTQQQVHDFWWKREFQVAIEKIVQGIQAQSEKTVNLDVLDMLYRVSYRDRVYSFNSATQPCIMIGSKKGCDILLDRDKNPALSRLHAVIYLLPAQNLVLLLDVGSTNGVRHLYGDKGGGSLGCVFSLKWKERNEFMLRSDDARLILGC